MTEDEAKLRWCPFARVTDNGCATNRHAGTKKGKDGKPRILRGNALCIASECMAWRWDEWDANGGRQMTKTHGYCGLAGKP